MYSKLLFSSKCQLAEGLHWDDRRQLIWFVDIDSKNLISLDIDTLSSRVIDLPEKIGWVITEKNTNELIIGLKGGIASINPDFKKIKFNWITKKYPKEENMRLNDAKADRLGSIWFGTLNDVNQELSDGYLARIDLSGEIKIIDSGYKVPNGPAIDFSRQRFFHTDSLRRIIYKFDINLNTSELSNKKTWKEFDRKYGFPDGMCFDNEGLLWVAHWGAGIVTRLDNNANIVDSVKIPTKNVTNICFGGINNDRLLVSTARSDDISENDNNAGSIYEVMNHATSGAKVYSSNIVKSKS